MVAKDLVELHLVVALTLGQRLEDQHAGKEELAARKLSTTRGPDSHRPSRDLASADLGTGLRVDDRDRGVQDRAGTKHRPTPHAGPLHHHAAAADERLVLDHHRPGIRRLEHAADAYAPG